MKNIALFGGTFDPPHLGHVLTITALLNSKHVDEVWVVPVGDDRADKIPIAEAAHRAYMVEMMISEYFASDPVKLERAQLDGRLPGSYTVDLFKYLDSGNNTTKLSFVIGADNALKIKDWKEGSWLWSNASFIVMPRLGQPSPAGLPSNFKLLSTGVDAQTDASSSAIRAALKVNRKLNGVVSSAITKYIHKNAIYEEKI